MKIVNKKLRELQISSQDITVEHGTNFKEFLNSLDKDLSLDKLSKELNNFANDNYYDHSTNYDVLELSKLEDYFLEKKIPSLIILIDIIYNNEHERDYNLPIWDNINGLNTDLIIKLKEKDKLLNDKIIKKIENEYKENYLV